MHTLFISDLHLDPSRPKKIELFLAFLEHLNEDVDALYILGDLFEFWHGDDDNSERYNDIINGLKHKTEQGLKIHIMRGNRDFLLNKQFERDTGAQLLNDPGVHKLYGESVLIMHGDLLCTDDSSYQSFRKITSNAFLQKLFMLLPLGVRKKIAKRVRQHSSEGIKQKAPEIMDVNQQTVESYMKRYSVNKLIHGHTHRRDTHYFKLNDRDAIRIVLGDWYGEDSVLVYSANHESLIRIHDYLREY